MRDILKDIVTGLAFLTLAGCGTEPKSQSDELDLPETNREDPLRGSPTGSGFGEVGLLSGEGDIKYCSGTLIAADVVLTTSTCARQRPERFSSDGKRGNSFWADSRKVTGITSKFQVEAPQDSSTDGLAVVFLDRLMEAAPHVDVDRTSQLREGERLWMAGFGSDGGKASRFSARERRYAGAKVVRVTDDRVVLELDAGDLACADDRGAGVFREDAEFGRRLVGVVSETAANPGDSEGTRGCARRVEVLRAGEQVDWIDRILGCSCRGRRFPGAEQDASTK